MHSKSQEQKYYPAEFKLKNAELDEMVEGEENEEVEKDLEADAFVESLSCVEKEEKVEKVEENLPWKNPRNNDDDECECSGKNIGECFLVIVCYSFPCLVIAYIIIAITTNHNWLD